MEQGKSKLVIGCGYVGKRVAIRWKSMGFRVFVTTRSVQRAQELRAAGLEPCIVDVSERSSFDQCFAEISKEINAVLFAVGFDRKSGLPIEEVYTHGLRHTLETLANPSIRFVYLSSTGVYGETQHEWVHERTVCRPVRDGGKACLAAERILQDDENSTDHIILRLAGIYGPGRVPRLQQLQSGDPFPCRLDGFLNLIHVDDTVEVILQVSSAKESIPRLLLVSDGCPVLRSDFYKYAANLVGVQPNFVPLEEDSPKADRALGSKRCDNRLLRTLLHQSLRYPSYREGLRSILTNS